MHRTEANGHGMTQDIGTKCTGSASAM